MTERSSEGLDERRKKLLFRAWRRGVRETDLIVGRFADAHIGTLDEPSLDDFERLIEVPNSDLYAWVSGETRHPGELRHRRAAAAQDLSRARQGGAVTAPTKLQAQSPAATAKTRPAADACRHCRRRRRLGHRRPGPRHCGGRFAAGHQHGGDLPRRPAPGDAVARARLLRPRHRDLGIPGLGLPALRPGVAARRHRGAAHDRARAAWPA